MSEIIEKSQVEKPAAQAANNAEILEQLLKPEVQESLTLLVEQLPKLTEMVTVLTKSYDFAQSLATDEVLKNDTVSAVTEIMEPIVHGAKSVAQVAIEAKERAEESNETIGLFGMLKMVRDPQVQKLFRFANAYLQIQSERDNQK